MKNVLWKRLIFEIQRILTSMGCLTASQKLSTPNCWEKREDHKGRGLEKPWGLLELFARPKARLWPFWDLEVKRKRLHLLWKEHGQRVEDIQVLYSCGPSCRKAWSVVFKACAKASHLDLILFSCPLDVNGKYFRAWVPVRPRTAVCPSVLMDLYAFWQHELVLMLDYLMWFDRKA